MSATQLKTPVGLVIFNRPDVTERVFRAIAQVRPQQLFVIADGPRSPEEREKCERTRAIVQQVDWDCDVFTHFSEENLGCGRRPSSGFDWVFSQVEEAIFLEDDTLPDPSFFNFCQTLLERYRDDERVMHISGDNSVNPDCVSHSYYFSKYMHCWGWASWRRAWQHFDYHMHNWIEFRDSGQMELVCERLDERQHWTALFDQMHADPQVIDAWDIQWLYACWSQSGLSITPQKNLVSNLGFNRPDAIHTYGDSIRAALRTTAIDQIHHPPFVVQQRVADRRTFDLLFNQQLQMRIRRRLLSTRKKLGLAR